MLRRKHLLVPNDPDRTFSKIQAARYLWAIEHIKGPTLDAACGVGLGTQLIARAGHIAVGVDISPQAIMTAARFANNGPMAWYCNDLLQAPWEDDLEGFESVVTIETLEHLEDDVGALQVFYDTLSPGGILVGSVPNSEEYPFGAHQEEYPHLRHYTREEIRDKLHRVGFHIESWWGQRGRIYEEKGKRRKKMTLAVQPGAEGLFLCFVAVKP